MSGGAGPGRWLAIVGIGEDGVEGLSKRARELIAAATTVIGGERHLRLAAPLIQGEQRAWPSPIADGVAWIKRQRGTPLVVLASGDPFCHGIGATLARDVPIAEMEVVPAPSAFSLACARLGWPLQETEPLSLCGHPLETLARHLQPGAKLLVLSADETTPAKVAAYLDGRGFGETRMHLLEALGGPKERHRSVEAKSFEDLGDPVQRLNLIAFEVVAGSDATIVPLAAGLPDALFDHDGQLTKREIRAATLSVLAPRAGERIWDVGLGAGSVAIEWLLAHPANHAIGIEADAERAARARTNAARLGVPRLEVIEGTAPAAFAGLPRPNAIFIGGGVSQVGLLDAAWDALGPGGRLVANAVTLQGEAVLVDAYQRYHGDLMRFTVARAGEVGRLNAFRNAMTVTQLRASKP